jgi:hypothetical protein
VVGAEALIRWRDPALGEVPPGRFIPVAEDTGFIVAIGDWVLEQAVRQAAAWVAEGRSLTVAVNVSALQFRQNGFVERVAAVLQAHRCPRGWNSSSPNPSWCATPTRPCSACRPWRRSGCGCRSTTSAPATRAWPT